MSKVLAPSQSDEAIANKARAHLEQVVAIESASDEDSTSIPSTEGQAELAQEVGRFFGALGATVERDDYANIIATFPGRGRLMLKHPVMRFRRTGLHGRLGRLVDARHHGVPIPLVLDQSRKRRLERPIFQSVWRMLRSGCKHQDAV